MKPTDLRGMLHYIPQFRDKLFIIAIDGAIVADDNFGNILLDIAVLRSLSIEVIIVHGASHQIRQFAKQFNVTVGPCDGTGVTDAETLKLSILAANQVSHDILEGLTLTNLRGAVTNCIEAVPVGIIKGVDYQHTGKVHEVDTAMLTSLMEKNVIPVVPPLGIDRNGKTYRINSDAIAVELARAMGAVKLMFISTRDGLVINKKLIRQIGVADLDYALKMASGSMAPEMISKAEHALRACQGGVGRVHIVNGTQDEAILAEVFSNEGIGTLVYADEYQAIRKAMRKDIRNIMALIKPSITTEELMKRTRADVEKQLGDYHVFEIDNNIVGVVAIHPYPDEKKVELACLQVNPMLERRGIGTKMAVFAENIAREQGFKEMFCLSTQAFTFFQHKLGYREGSIDDLPQSRREKYEQSGRHSKILVKSLT
jgi:amino-acid N-acetyltransferase